eukprot:scaffold51268_cov30-Tisochrysis_lutea.AAC.1
MISAHSSVKGCAHALRAGLLHLAVPEQSHFDKGRCSGGCPCRACLGVGARAARLAHRWTRGGMGVRGRGWRGFAARARGPSAGAVWRGTRGVETEMREGRGKAPFARPPKGAAQKGTPLFYSSRWSADKRDRPAD